jgi:putative DNA primase/helicase
MNKYDPTLVEKVMDFLDHRATGGATEVRIMLAKNNVVSGYFVENALLAKAVAGWDGKANIYITINPTIPELSARAYNRLQQYAKVTTSDNDILQDLWFVFDTDPIRPAGISATDAELELALKRRDEIADFFSFYNVTVVKGMSGNGGHGLIKLIGYPNNAETRKAKEKFLHYLAKKFSDDKVSVDDTVFNMARIWKLYGTLAVKGDNVPDRPHRRSYLEIPANPVQPVDLYAMLDKIIPPEESATKGKEEEKEEHAEEKEGSAEEKELFEGGVRLDVESYLEAAGVEYRIKTKGDWTWYQLYDCPIHSDPDGDHFECSIGQEVNGMLGAKCMHDPTLGWQEFKEALGDPTPYFRGKKPRRKYFRGKTFIPKKLADELMSEYRFIYAGEMLYVYQNGVYQPEAEHFVAQECQKRLGNNYKKERMNEVVHYIEVACRCKVEELNTKPHLINLNNGLYDWIEEKLLPHEEDYLSTVRIPVKYDPAATCPTVDYFLTSTLPPDCIPIAEELFGYALIPDVRFEKAFMFTGTGSNGKSTFLTLLEAFVGSDNVSKIPLQELDENRFKRAELFGKLVNLFADLDQRALQSSTYFKTIVSGDMIDAERKHKDPFFFRPFARLAYSANQLPQSPDRSFAYYRRWGIIPFPHQFVGDKDDKSLRYKLTKASELSGLLNRALKGLNRLFEQEGFSESATVKEALEDYKRQNDTVAAFIADCCEFAQDAEIERTELYTAYTQYCDGEGFEAVSRRFCYDRVRAQFRLGEKTDEKGKRYFTGLRLKR